MLSFSDQTQHTIQLPKVPKRIISLVPSQTELLFDLGLNEEVIGITKFCVHPQQWFHSKTRVGGTKQVNMTLIESLKPELILANKEENVKEQVESLASRFPVWTSDISKPDDAYEMITQVGALTGKERNALALVTKIKNSFSRFEFRDKELSAAYLIWREPMMTVGGDTFIHAMMKIAGFRNAFENQNRYPEISLEELQHANPDILLLSSEPFPFKQKHIDELQPHLPNMTIILVDGEMFSWYGSRMQYAAAYFQKLRDKINR